jgi:hypothetical protein
MLINFNLFPLENIADSVNADSPPLRWFGLSQGEYWMELGENTLFEYSENVLPDGMRHCEYPVARLHADLMDMLPSILEPVPESLAPYLFGEEAAECWDAWTAWCDRHAEELGQGHAQELEYALLALTSGRQHIADYVDPPTRFVCWSDEETVHFAWDNRHAELHGKPVWTAVYGEYQMPRREFIEEVQQFHMRLMEQMAQRVEAVLTGALPPKVRVDINMLEREHALRYDTFHDALNQEAQTDWEQVQAAVDEIMASRQGEEE